jgi:hypothetical protein
MWEIRGSGGALLGRYVGKAKSGAKRPRTHYARNVANILSGKPYRKGNPNGYRRIRQALAEAQRQGHSITLQFLCNVMPGESINIVEQRLTREHNCLGQEPWQLNG